MKKIVISSLLLVIMALPLAPIPVRAQAFSAEQQTTLEELRQQIIALLLQQIAILQAKIDEIIASQTQSVVLGSQSAPEEIPLVPKPTVVASIGTISKFTDNGVQKNLIPVIFGDAIHVTLITNCPQANINGGLIRNEVRVSRMESYALRYGNFGNCSYTMTSYDGQDKVFGSSSGEFDLGL